MKTRDTVRTGVTGHRPGRVVGLMAAQQAVARALDAGATIRQAQEFAGHADPKTTVHYDRTRKELDKSAAHFIHLGED